MKEKQDLYSSAMELLREVNAQLKGENSLSTINIHMAAVVKALNDINIKDIIAENAAEEQEKTIDHYIQENGVGVLKQAK
jgi:maleate cis-trans isomerase